MRLAVLPAVLALLCLAQPPLTARQETARSDRNANYTISARLDPASRTITAVSRMNWRNRTASPVSTLRLHLYWNAWRDADSTWMREATLAGDTDATFRSQEDRSAIDLTTLRVVDGPDLLPTLRFIAPDDGNSRDMTLAEVTLDQPLAPGAAVSLDAAWTARVPRPFARTGVIGRDFVIAHWFPKIGVLEDDGWHASQFHAGTEFFADFGTYDLSLTVPTGWVVGASGRETTRDVHDNGTTTHRYRAEDVHDAAWVASPDFLEHTTRVEFDDPARPPVDVRLLLRPEHSAQADRHLSATRAILREASRRLGPFPWPNLTVVDPVTIVNPYAQGGMTSGMEYPTLILAGTYWSNRWADVALEDVLAHEIAHQYFQSAVANDEVRHAWLDEGIATWVSNELLESIWPNRFVAIDRWFGGIVTWRHPDVRWSPTQLGFMLDTYRREPGWDASTTPTWRQSPRTWAHTNYLRAPLALETLRRVIGDEPMTAVLSTFAARGRFRHVVPDDFTQAVNEVSGRDMSWLLEATLGRSDTFDYAVEDVVHRDTETGVESTVIVRRRASGVFPVDIHVTFEDGREVFEQWDGVSSWREFTYDDTRPVTRVEIDRARVLVLDVHRTNNTWTANPRAEQAADRWTQRWIAWMQHVLLTYAFFI